MRDHRKIGYFVHHQGRGHAERAAAIANALIDRRDVTLFCARDDIFPTLDPRIEIVVLPSLFEPTGREAPGMASLPMPSTTHCAPIGWPSITKAMAMLTDWFSKARPALFITDVSAELAQLARLCSVPHICVLQHGNRGDAGHMAAYEGAVGLLAPYHTKLEQPDRPRWMIDKTHYASGVGVDNSIAPSKRDARRDLGLSPHDDIVLVIGGGGGDGTPAAPLTLGARAQPRSRWISIGAVQNAWHETPPGNLEHRGWVDNPQSWIAAADRVVSSCGNTTVHMVLVAGKPWVIVPEWRYFDEQLRKAEVLGHENLAAYAPDLPSHIDAWTRIWKVAAGIDVAAQRSLIDNDADLKAAEWIDGLCVRLWADDRTSAANLEAVA